jgi:hypothetical protein
MRACASGNDVGIRRNGMYSAKQSKAKQSRTKQGEAAHHTLLSNRGADPLCCRSCRFAAQRTTWPSGADNDDGNNDDVAPARLSSHRHPSGERPSERERESRAWWWRWRRRPSHAILCWLRRRTAMRHGAPSTGFQSMSCRIGMAVGWAGGTTRRRVAGRVAGRLRATHEASRRAGGVHKPVQTQCG